jgi:hypothetical protein
VVGLSSRNQLNALNASTRALDALPGADLNGARATGRRPSSRTIVGVANGVSVSASAGSADAAGLSQLLIVVPVRIVRHLVRALRRGLDTGGPVVPVVTVSGAEFARKIPDSRQPDASARTVALLNCGVSASPG